MHRANEYYSGSHFRRGEAQSAQSLLLLPPPARGPCSLTYPRDGCQPLSPGVDLERCSRVDLIHRLHTPRDGRPSRPGSA